jgi:hypothetical protein
MTAEGDEKFRIRSNLSCSRNVRTSKLLSCETLVFHIGHRGLSPPASLQFSALLQNSSRLERF